MKKINQQQTIIFNFLIIFGLGLIICLLGGPLWADEAGTGIGIPNPLTIKNLPELLGRIADFIQTLAIALCLPFFLWGGVVIITSGGDPQKVKNGRNIIIFTMVGVIVAFLAKTMFSILETLFPTP
ncbi:MAG TPA: hypothetical protein PL093_02040 [Candidatus Pacearchaeota archaeon]|jgi:hypothetical protein|nr:hypothetical protein [Candidatus Pacearchaeota archaeon]HRR94774.1 hypothetical protein [Candidatus Paceibacterota bacterium]HPC30591.1 hypothetical protein [Candidatus Pacearchaeota archaeon]HQG09155.1 hypothetical protein [Candidatus Pacearchaeota archaeon]HQH20336.1 hypothetical protein [Candidatus Pacearchaeota archaeon]